MDKRDQETKFGALKTDIQNLSTKLKELGVKKEDQYKKKNDLETDLNNLINSANKIKEEKKRVDEEIRALKRDRDQKNNEVKEFINKLHKLKAKRATALKKKKFDSVKDLKKQIRSIEFIVQTEVLNFEKEKKYMKQIRGLKAKLDEIKSFEDQFAGIRESQEEIRATKAEADKIHEKIQGSAKKSSQMFDELTVLSKKISNIKSERSSIRNVLKALKNQINNINTSLSTNLKDLSKFADALFPGSSGKEAEIKEKTKAVKKKLKQKKKLTTKDILLLQREAMKK